MVKDMANMNNIDKYFLELLIGFLDAEGYFQKTIEKRGNKKDFYFKISYNFLLHISLSIVDLELLTEIKQFLGMGKINLYPHRNEAYFVIYRQKELEQLVFLLSHYNLLTKNQFDNFHLLKRGVLQNIKKAQSLVEKKSSFFFKDPFMSSTIKKRVSFLYIKITV